MFSESFLCENVIFISLHKKYNLGKRGLWKINFYSNFIAISPLSLLAFIVAEGKSNANIFH